MRGADRGAATTTPGQEDGGQAETDHHPGGLESAVQVVVFTNEPLGDFSTGRIVAALTAYAVLLSVEAWGASIVFRPQVAAVT